MVLANRIRVQNSRTLLRAFGGLNEGYGCSEAEYSAGINFSSRDFPALSTRKPRRKLRTLTGLNGMYHLNGLLTVCGKDLVYTPDDGGETVTCTDAVADSKKALVGLGTKILIFPDKVAFDTADGSVSALGACWKAEGQSVEFAPCDAEGRTYTPTGVGREEPESPADGQIFLKVEDEEHPWRYDGTLEVYSAASGNWTALPLDYCRITAAGAQEKFCQWDTVTVQGTAAKQAGQWEALDGDCVVYAVTENSLCVRADPAGDYFYGTLVQGTDAAQWTSLDGSQTRSIAAEQTVQLERRVPDLDFVTECDNRVWGCSSRENVIYACKLGDPTNWFSYRGIAADSYAVTVGSDGAFTGAATCMGYALFFKENTLHKLCGTKPSDFQLTSLRCRGVAKNAACITSRRMGSWHGTAASPPRCRRCWTPAGWLMCRALWAVRWTAGIICTSPARPGPRGRPGCWCMTPNAGSGTKRMYAPATWPAPAASCICGTGRPCGRRIPAGRATGRAPKVWNSRCRLSW